LSALGGESSEVALLGMAGTARSLVRLKDPLGINLALPIGI
jgi:hypothetical protein